MNQGLRNYKLSHKKEYQKTTPIKEQCGDDVVCLLGRAGAVVYESRLQETFA